MGQSCFIAIHNYLMCVHGVSGGVGKNLGKAHYLYTRSRVISRVGSLAVILSRCDVAVCAHSQRGEGVLSQFRRM